MKTMAMAVLIVYFSFIPGIVGYNRFRIPVLPYISIFSALGAQKVLHHLHGRGYFTIPQEEFPLIPGKRLSFLSPLQEDSPNHISSALKARSKNK